MVWASPSKVGDRAASIPPVKAALRRFEYGRTPALGDSDEYTAELGVALRKFQAIAHAEVVAGKRPTPDVLIDGAVSWATQVQLGTVKRAVPVPAVPKVRHPAIVFRGTGGIIGADYVSRVCQANADVVEEINPDWPATMGGLPVGAAGGISDPSMWRGNQIALADAQRIFLERFRANPKVKVVVGGYSAGAVVGALFRQWLLENFPGNYLCSFSLGDPTRPKGGAFYGGNACPGQGISSWRYGDTRDYRHCWLAQPGDMYTSIPGGVVGDIMDDAYDLVTRFEFSDVFGFAAAMLPKIPEVAAKAGISVPAVLGGLAAGPVGLALPLLLGALPGLIGNGNPDTLTGTAAAAKAAMLALQFMTANPPTGPHITYEFGEVWPGQTYLGLAIQHVRDHATRVPAVAA